MRIFMLVIIMMGVSVLVDAIGFRDPRIKEQLGEGSLFQEMKSFSDDFREPSKKGIDYYLLNYGPLVKVIATDVMDSFGIGRSLQLALPIIMKMLVIGMYAIMQFDSSLLTFQGTVQASYNFLRSFNAPDLHMVNEITDRVFSVIDEASLLSY